LLRVVRGRETYYRQRLVDDGEEKGGALHEPSVVVVRETELI
jgi:hypothetical protein